MYMHTYIYMYTYIYTYIYVYVYVLTYTYVHIHIYIYTYIYKYMRVSTTQIESDPIQSAIRTTCNTGVITEGSPDGSYIVGFEVFIVYACVCLGVCVYIYTKCM